MSITEKAAYPTTDGASSVPTQKATQLWLPPNLAGEGEYAASFGGPDCDSRLVYALQCTAGNIPAPGRCGPDAPVLTVAEWATDMVASSTAISDGTTIEMRANCSFHGSASCTEHYTTHVSGSAATRAVTTAIATPTSFGIAGPLYDVTITAGLADLTITTLPGTCTPTAKDMGSIELIPVGAACLVVIALVLLECLNSSFS